MKPLYLREHKLLIKMIPSYIPTEVSNPKFKCFSFRLQIASCRLATDINVKLLGPFAFAVRQEMRSSWSSCLCERSRVWLIHLECNTIIYKWRLIMQVSGLNIPQGLDEVKTNTKMLKLIMF